MKMDSSISNIPYKAQFCLLAYHPGSVREAPRSELLVMLATLQPRTNKIRFRVHASWRDIVLPEHHEYFESILPDLKERADMNPLGLFQQLRTLNSGPLVTYGTGPDISSEELALQTYRKFVAL